MAIIMSSWYGPFTDNSELDIWMERLWLDDHPDLATIPTQITYSTETLPYWSNPMTALTQLPDKYLTLSRSVVIIDDLEMDH
jgi:hypothetical protein